MARGRELGLRAGGADGIEHGGIGHRDDEHGGRLVEERARERLPRRSLGRPADVGRLALRADALARLLRRQSNLRDHRVDDLLRRRVGSFGAAAAPPGATRTIVIADAAALRDAWQKSEHASSS